MMFVLLGSSFSLFESCLFNNDRDESHIHPYPSNPTLIDVTRNSSWNVQVADPLVTPYHSSIGIDNENNPCIAYWGEDGTLRLARYTNYQWTSEIVDSSELAENGTISLAMDSNGRPHICYEDGWPRYDSKYARYNGMEWEVEVIDSQDYVYCQAITIDSNDNPHVFYSHYRENDPSAPYLKYAYRDNTRWNIETINTSYYTGGSIALNSDGHPYIVHNADESNLNLTYWNGTGWTSESIDRVVSYGVSISMKNDDTPYLAYRSEDGLICAYRYEQQWKREVIDNLGEKGGFDVDIELNSINEPSICYYYNDDYKWLEGRLKYAHRNGGHWEVETIIDEEVNPYSSLAIDGNDQPHVSFTLRGYNSQGLRYAKRISESVNDIPIIEDDLSEEDPTTGDFFSLNVKISENISAQDVVAYCIFKPRNYYNASMVLNNEEFWEIDIGIPPNAKYFYYHFMVIDDTGNHFTTPITKLDVIDNDKPIVEAGEDQTIEMGETATFNGTNISDNVIIYYGYWTFVYDGEEQKIYDDVVEFTFEIPGKYNISYFIFDLGGNNGSDNLTLTVLENDTDNDGYNDTYENESGSDPYDPRSTPLDWDGDGVPNEEDAYPRDASRWERESSFPYRILLVLGVLVIITILIIVCYSRIKAGKVLEQGGRQEIYSFIRDNPGEHYRAIKRKLGVSRGMLSHHLRKLEETGMIRSRRVSYYKLFYPAGSDLGKRPLTPGQKKIVSIIRRANGISTREIARRMNKKPQTVRYHLAEMADRGLVSVEKNENYAVWVISDRTEESG